MGPKSDRVPSRLLNAVRSLTRRVKEEEALPSGSNSTEKDRWNSLELLYVNLERMADHSDFGMMQSRVEQRLRETINDRDLHDGLQKILASCSQLNELRLIMRFALEKKEQLSQTHLHEIQTRLARYREGELPPSLSEKLVEQRRTQFIDENKTIIKDILNLVGRDLSLWPDELADLKNTFSGIIDLFKKKEISKLNRDNLEEIKGTVTAIAGELQRFLDMKNAIASIDFTQLDDPETNLEIQEALSEYDHVLNSLRGFANLDQGRRERLKQEIDSLALLYDQLKFELESEAVSIDDYEISITAPPEAKPVPEFVVATSVSRPPSLPVERVAASPRQGPMASQFIFRVEPDIHKHFEGETAAGIGKVVYFWPVGAPVNENLPLILKASPAGVEGYIFISDTKHKDKILHIQPKQGKNIMPEILLSVCIKKLLKGDFDQTLARFF
ncbi:hypothetical protein JXQ70_09765 [bacterium]|nr:hypothetical protein [bacterium]